MLLPKSSYNTWLVLMLGQVLTTLVTTSLPLCIVLKDLKHLTLNRRRFMFYVHLRFQCSLKFLVP